MADNDFINNIFETVLTPVLAVLKFVFNLLFSNYITIFIFFIILVNVLAIILMKKDKSYAENGERRVRESTLLTVALVGGSLGIYYSMFKYKHKTLHTQFAVGVPIIICLQSAFLSYFVMTKLFLV